MGVHAVRRPAIFLDRDGTINRALVRDEAGNRNHNAKPANAAINEPNNAAISQRRRRQLTSHFWLKLPYSSSFAGAGPIATPAGSG